MRAGDSNNGQDGRTRRRGQGPLALALGVAAAALVFAGTVLVLRHALTALGVEAQPVTQIDRVGDLHAALLALAEREPDADALDVAILGDSSVYEPEDGGAFERFFSERLGETNAQRHVRTYRLAAPGIDAYTLFFAAAAAARSADPPDAAIVALNVAALSEVWRAGFALPEAAALLPVSALPRALRLPGDWIGLSADGMLEHQALLRVLGFEAWQRLVRFQIRSRKARDALELAAGGAEADLVLRLHGQRMQLVLAPRRRGRPERASRVGYERRYRPMFEGLAEDHPPLQAFAAAVRELTSAGIPTLVYVVPVNVEHLRTLELGPGTAFARSLETIENTSVAAGAHYADLHASQPDRAFRDSGEHLTFRGRNPGMRVLARQLAALVDRLLERRPASEQLHGD